MDNVTGVFVAFLIAALPLAVLITKATDLVRNLLDKGDTLPKGLWNVVPFVLGAGLCLGWQLNLATTLAHSIPALAKDTHLDGVWGQLLTGLAIGAMAGFWHEKLDSWSGLAKARRAQVPAATQN